jgi:Mpv17 / PMP22 family
MLWHSNWWRRLAGRSTALLEPDEWSFMAAVGGRSSDRGVKAYKCEAIFGPAATQWYRLLTKINLGGTVPTTAARVLADQTIFATCNVGLFLSSMAYMEGVDPKERLRSKYIEVIKTNWLVWPGVQAVNFTLVPLHHRVLVVNIVSLGWNCYLSWANSQQPSAKLKEDSAKS